jgi:pimeloyl-ACP methyl ester carboxylesterase
MAAWLVVALALLLVGCPAEPSAPLDPPPEEPVWTCSDPDEVDESPFRVVFPGDVGPHYPDPVLPSDFYLVEEAGRFRAQWDDLVLPNSLGHTDGFTTITPVLLPLVGTAEPATLTSDRFVLFDVQGADELPFELMHREDEDLVYLVPTRPPPQAATVAVAVLGGITDSGGQPMGPPAHQVCLEAGWQDPDYTLLGEGVTAARAWLDAAGFDDVVYINTFHTAAPIARLQAAAAAMEAAAVAGRVTGSFEHVLTATDDTDRITDEVHALLAADTGATGLYPALETYVQGSLTIPDVSHALDGEEAPADPPTQTAPFTALLPSMAVGEELPVVLFLHGIAACRDTVLGLSNQFNGDGAILAAIDARQHYVRYDPEATECGWDPYAMAFIDIVDPRATDQRFPLTALDVLALQRFLEAELDGLLAELASEQGLETPPTAGTFHVVGHSLGGMLATELVAAWPDDEPGRLVGNTTGASLITIVMPAIHDGLLREPLDGDNLRLFIEAETSFALAEPASYAPAVRADWLLQVAQHDETLPNAMSEMLAMAGGLPLLQPSVWEVEVLADGETPAEGNLEDGRTGGMFQFSPSGHNMLFGGVAGDPDSAWRAQEQIVRFLDEGIVVDAYSME